MEVARTAILNKYITDENTLRLIFNSLQENLVHQNKELRTGATDLLK